jgi:hypothetical protein
MMRACRAMMALYRHDTTVILSAFMHQRHIRNRLRQSCDPILGGAQKATIKWPPEKEEKPFDNISEFVLHSNIPPIFFINNFARRAPRRPKKTSRI